MYVRVRDGGEEGMGGWDDGVILLRGLCIGIYGGGGMGDGFIGAD
jgi:hypothetical protein